jgi:hypothetical protein
MASIRQAESGVDLTALKRDDNGRYNVIRDLMSFSGVLARENATCRVTSLGEAYKGLYDRSKEDAWRWLITRSLWLYVVPNGTDVGVNEVASRLHANFSFFRTILGVLWHLYALQDMERYCFYDELCVLFDEDSAWTRPSSELFQNLLERRRSQGGNTGAVRGLLGDLENQYHIPRDNLNTVLNKAFQQTGLFDYARHGARTVGIAISSSLDKVLQNRIRFIVDHPVTWAGGDWSQHLQPRAEDLAQEISLVPTEVPDEEPPSEGIDNMVSEAVVAFSHAGLKFDETIVRRFVASLLTKPFVILTGLSGSGKTKLAQAFAAWLCPLYAPDEELFFAGALVSADRIQYRVINADVVAVEFENPEGIRAVIPRGLIEEWVDAIRENGFDRGTAARTIRDKVAERTRYSGQINSFETHLKAAAFATIENVSAIKRIRRYEIVSVGADWVAKESCLGYSDALNIGKYVKTTPILDLLLQSRDDPKSPYFLVLDEMNLSHVERYFADFLSAMESGERIALHGSNTETDGVPPSISLPLNFFIAGTVNVDETTYVFSPKVLDRANSLEFRTEAKDLLAQLRTPTAIDLRRIAGQGSKFSRAFVMEAMRTDASPTDGDRSSAEISLLFDVMSLYGCEFGFRTASEIVRFVYFHRKLTTGIWNFHEAMDAQVCQKILPKLNGSRRRLEPVLCALALLCHRDHVWNDDSHLLANRDQLFNEAKEAGTLENERLHPLISPANFESQATYPISFSKIKRMLERLVAEGFASFAEA